MQKLRIVKGRTYKYVPVFMDKWSDNAGHVPSGTLVKVIQPYGCPKNGTMGMCYVDNADTGEFIGLICINSLQKH